MVQTYRLGLSRVCTRYNADNITVVDVLLVGVFYQSITINLYGFKGSTQNHKSGKSQRDQPLKNKW